MSPYEASSPRLPESARLERRPQRRALLYLGEVPLQTLDAARDLALVDAIQVVPERRPPARETRRALDLADDAQDVVVQQGPVLPWQQLPALE